MSVVPADLLRRRDLAVAIVLIGFSVAVVVHYVLGQYFGYGYPESTFLFKPNEASVLRDGGSELIGVHLFGDFFQVWHQTRQPSPYVSDNPFFRSNYPPLAHLLVGPFAFLQYEAAVLTYLTLLGIALFLVVYRALPGDGAARVQAAFVLALLTYPVLFLIDRANIDGFALLFVWWAFLARHDRWWVSPALVGLAGAVKIYPGAFVLVYVQQRRWREVGVTVGTAALATTVALMTFAGGPIQGVQDFIKGVQGFTTPASGSGAQYIQHTNSLTSAAKALIHLGVLPDDSLVPARRLNLVLMALVVAALCLLPMLLWQKLYLVCMLTTVLLEASFDYRLSFFLIPLVALIVDKEARGRLATTMLVIISLIMIPKSQPSLYADVTVGVLLNPLLVIVGALVIVGSASRGRATAFARIIAPSPRSLEQAT